MRGEWLEADIVAAARPTTFGGGYAGAWRTRHDRLKPIPRTLRRPEPRTREEHWAREDADLELAMRFTDPAEAMGECPAALFDDTLAVPAEHEAWLDEAFDRGDLAHSATSARRMLARRLRAVFPPSKDDAAWRDRRETYRRGRQWVARSLAVQRSQSAVLGLVTSLTDEEWAALVEAYEGRCGYCGELRETLHLDHVFPRARGGPFSLENAIPACSHCNHSKSDDDALEWMDAKGIDADAVFERLEAAREHVRRKVGARGGDHQADRDRRSR